MYYHELKIIDHNFEGVNRLLIVNRLSFENDADRTGHAKVESKDYRIMIDIDG